MQVNRVCRNKGCFETARGLNTRNGAQMLRHFSRGGELSLVKFPNAIGKMVYSYLGAFLRCIY